MKPKRPTLSQQRDWLLDFVEYAASSESVIDKTGPYSQRLLELTTKAKVLLLEVKGEKVPDPKPVDPHP